MKPPRALFLNGVYNSVLKEILSVQAELPEQVMFMQPYSPKVIGLLRDHGPAPESPIQVFFSTTDDLQTVRYRAEIVGWDDKRLLSPTRRGLINRLIAALQPGEKELYNATAAEGGESVNLLHLWRLRPIDPPFRVGTLIKIDDGQPLSENRSRSGGWAYVQLLA